MDPPQVVAEVKPCYDARSIESSKFHGFEDRYAIVGCYWPALAVVLDGLTLEPLKMIGTAGYERGAGGYVEEARVAAIVASHFHPEWIVNIKEAGPDLVRRLQPHGPARPAARGHDARHRPLPARRWLGDGPLLHRRGQPAEQAHRHRRAGAHGRGRHRGRHDPAPRPRRQLGAPRSSGPCGRPATWAARR
jgi:hypothetical protein